MFDDGPNELNTCGSGVLTSAESKKISTYKYLQRKTTYMSIPYSDDLPWYYGLRLVDLYDGILNVKTLQWAGKSARVQNSPLGGSCAGVRGTRTTSRNFAASNADLTARATERENLHQEYHRPSESGAGVFRLREERANRNSATN